MRKKKLKREKQPGKKEKVGPRSIVRKIGIVQGGERMEIR